MASKLRLGAALLAGSLPLAACNAAEGSGGDTITVGMFATTSAATSAAFVNTWSVDGVQAGLKVINDAGGVDGKKIRLKVCDNAGDPNRDAACARRAVQEKWVAVLGGFDPYAPSQTLPVLEAGDIPYIGYLQGTPTEYQSKVSFPVAIGTVGGYVGTFSQMVQDGCKRPVFIGASDAGSDVTYAQAKDVLGGAPGVAFKGAIKFTTGTTDVTPTVADALAQSPDCLAFGGGGNDAAKIFAAVRKAGNKATLYAPPGVLQPQVISALGKAAEGIKGASDTPLPNSSDPSVRTFLSDLRSYSPKAVPNGFALIGYSSTILLRQGLTGLDDVTAKSLLKRLGGMRGVKVMNFPPLDFTKTRASEQYPRMFNSGVWYGVVKDGQWTSSGSESPTDIGQYIK
ncbi:MULTISPECIES: ABC transporter substrate-binding protein [unclassified Actinomadura]|uniref:ABC transporter substrate-binding protein n=1 Tax=unclassified Actinomadura TaxID=2626254 RepID=UPI0011EF5160|nr:ABC transporter substrate-binding protein [Actinomadura sp. K4S16]